MSRVALQDALNERRAVYEQFAACAPDGAENIARGEALLADIEKRDRAIKILEAQVREADSAAASQAPAVDPTEARTGDEPETRDGVAARDYAAAFSGFLRHGMSGIEAEQKTVLRQGYIDGKEFRAQGVATGAAGGYFVPIGFRNKIVEALKAFGAVREVAEVITTETGNQLPWPTNDDTANVGAILAENTAVTEQDVILGQATLDAYTYTSKLVRVSLQLLQDSAFDVETWLARKLGERIGRATNAHFTTGTGTAQPDGIVTGSTIGKTGVAGQTLTVIYNDLVDLVHSVDPAYRNERSTFMAHDLSLAIVRKLRDDSGGAGLGRPLWEPSVQIGQPSTLMGYPIVANNDMPVMAANAKSILFGDFFTAYVVREVLGIQMLRLEERYADFLQVGFLSFMRTDGTTQDATAVKSYRNSAT